MVRIVFFALVFLAFACARHSGSAEFGVTGAEFGRSLLAEEQARSLADAHVVPSSSNAHYNFIRGELALHDGEIEEAGKFYEEAAKFESKPAPFLRKRLAQIYLRSGKLEPALDQVQQALVESSDDAELLEVQGGILAALKRRDEAIAVYRRLIEITSGEQEEPFVLIASLYAQDEKLAEARRVLEELLKIHPESFFGHYYSARMLELSGDLKGAEKHYRKALELNPNSESIQLDLARIYGGMKRFGDAKRICEEIIEKNPNNLMARNILGQLLLGENKVAEALREFEAMGRLQEDPSGTRFKIALIKLQNRDFEGALVELNLILAEHPDDGAARYYLGSVYAGMGRKGEAVAELLKVAPADRYYADARMLAGYFLRELERLPEAIRMLEEAVEKKSDDVRLLVYLSSLRRETKDIEGAIELVKRAIELEPREDRHYFTLGVFYDELDQTQKALDAMEKAIGINPENADALNYLGYTLADRGERLEEAEALIRRALAVEKDNGYFVDSLGWVFYRMGRFKDAYRELKRAVELVPDDSVILEHYGLVLLKLGRKAEALDVLRRGLSLAGDSDDEGVGDRLRNVLLDLENK